MTLAEIQEQVYKMTGEQSDLYPSSVYTQELTDAINEGQRMVASWKDPGGRLSFRAPSLTSQLYFQTYWISDALQDAGHTTTTIILPSDILDATTLATDDVLNGWSFTTASNTKRIVDYDGGTRTATLHEALTAAPATTATYELSKNYMDIQGSTHAQVAYNILKPDKFLLPIKIVDLEEEREITEAARDDVFINLVGSTSDPTEFVHRNDRILFDYVPDERRWYYMEYSKMPTDMVHGTSTGEPDIPEHFHYGIVLWGRWWGFAREQGLQAAWAAKQDFNDFMRQRVGAYYNQHDRRQVAGKLRRE